MDKKMITKRFFPIVGALMLAVALAVPGAAVAAEATATRTLPASADAGADFTVGIEASGCGSFGQVVETLPVGFSYLSTDSTDVDVTQDGNNISFTFIGDSVAFDYSVAASATEGSYSFSGIVKDGDLNEYAVGGDTDISVPPTTTPPPETVTEPPETVAVTVTETQPPETITETLPAETVTETVPGKPQINWPLTGGLIAAVVVVGLGVFFWMRRRAA